jgi:hypothetical protein
VIDLQGLLLSGGGVGRAPAFQNIIVIFNYQTDFQTIPYQSLFVFVGLNR